MLTTALCLLFLSFRQQPPPLDERAAKQQVVPDENDPLMKPPPVAAADAPEGDAAQGEVSEIPDETAALDVKPPTAKFPSRTVVLGSMDPAKGFNLLVTLTSRGAAVERAELVAPEANGGFKYRALEHEGGYLGYLGLVETVNGMRIRSVPPGSPAENAASPNGPMGLAVGDVLQEIDGVSVSSWSAFESVLEDRKPGSEVSLRIQRSVDGQPQQLDYSAVLSEPPLDLIRTRPFDSEWIAGNIERPSLRTTIGSIEGTNIPAGFASLPVLRPTMEADWEMKELEVNGGEGVEFRLALDSYLANTGRPAQLDLVKRYRLLPAGTASDGYILDLETIVENRGDAPVNLSMRQEGLAGLTLEGWWYSVKISPSFFSGAGSRDVAYANAASTHQALKTTRELHSHAQKFPSQPGLIFLSADEPPEVRSLRYIGLDAQYFNASILPHPEQPESMNSLRQAGGMAVADVDDIPKAKSQATNTAFWFDTSEQSVAPNGGQLKQRYKVFLGPKDGDVLATHGLDQTVEYGWPIFWLVAKPLGIVLHFFYSIVQNYGVAIVMLTVCVRAAMFPLGRKAAMNAQRMSELQPELAKINEKYKDNMEKRAKAMQELYAKHNFKPLAGCLPMFIQIPIFIGLYRCLSVDISLRQASLFPGVTDWCSNLAGPDQLLNWSSWMPDFIAGRGTGWLGPYFNLLPIITVGLFLLQQKMLMPKATDEQTRMTQNVMQVMTVFMGVLFFKVPSGLCIYFISSSLWSLVERKLVKRMTPPKSAEPATPAIANTESAKPTKSNSGRRGREPVVEKPKSKLQAMMEMIDKKASHSTTHRKNPKDKRR